MAITIDGSNNTITGISNTIEEDDLKVSNAGSNGQFLQKQSGNTGGLTWASVSSTPEGEAIQSTTNSNEASTKFLRADGDGTCSWQVPPAATSTSGTDNFTISDGNLVIGTAGHGIDFSANTSTSTTDAAMTTELLDWYEEGTFTPKITFGNTSDFSGGSYGTCEGTYTRVGRMVTISFTTSVSAKGSSSGLVHINGLPFASGGSTHRGGGRTSYSTFFSTETDNTDCQLYLGDSRTYLQCVHDSLDNLNASDCNNSGAINTTMQYQVP